MVLVVIKIVVYFYQEFERGFYEFGAFIACLKGLDLLFNGDGESLFLLGWGCVDKLMVMLCDDFCFSDDLLLMNSRGMLWRCCSDVFCRQEKGSEHNDNEHSHLYDLYSDISDDE